MTVIVAFPPIVAQPTHTIVIRDVFRMRLYKFLGAVPYGWDCFSILVETQNKAILFLVLYHEFEGVKADITEQLDARLDTPIPFILHH